LPGVLALVAGLAWSASGAVVLEKVVYTSDAVPGIAGTTWINTTTLGFQVPVIDNSGNVAFRARMGVGGPVTGTANDEGYWYGGPGSLYLITHEGVSATPDNAMSGNGLIAVGAGYTANALPRTNGNSFLVQITDRRSPCLSVFNGGILYLNGTTCEPARIHQSPVDQNVTSITSFGIISNCFASGSWHLNHQWQKEDINSPGTWLNMVDENCTEFNSTNFDVKGSTTSQLRLGQLFNVWPGRYRCVVTNACGSANTSEITICSGPNPCVTGPTCDSIDFNNDGLFPDTLDVDSMLSVFSGGPCL
jgi:hypothetical protein